MTNFEKITCKVLGGIFLLLAIILLLQLIGCDSGKADITSNIKQLDIRRVENEFTVIGTMYNPTLTQCDETPNITADGTRINPEKASQYRYVALSRDLLDRWGGPFNYGDYISIEGTSKGAHDGIWQVRDTMNPKWKNRVDFLLTIGAKPFRYNEITLTKYR